MASLWAETPEDDRQVYVKMATESKLKYDEQMRVWQVEFMKSQEGIGVAHNSKLSRSKSQAINREKKLSYEPSLPSVPRAPSAYMLFCRDERPKVVDPITGMKLPFVETTQQLAALWRECGASVKEKYQQLAAIEKEKIQQIQIDSTVTK